MRTKTLATAAALMLLTILPPGLAQEGAIPDQLEKMLEWALKANPDLALAEAKVKEAQAELNQTRLERSHSRSRPSTTTGRGCRR